MNVKHALYRTIWRWHFYAGLFCIPFVIILSVSGSIYLFKPQLDDWRESAFLEIKTTATRTTANEQINAALASLPSATFQSYRLPRTQNEAVRISVFSADELYWVYVNPFDLAIVNSVMFNNLFVNFVKRFHGELLIGNVGSILVELAACWAIVLIITGLYLAWPRESDGLAGALYPRLNLKGRRLWRDLHAVTGIYVAVFALFLLLSGLPWTLLWGSTFDQIRNLNAQIAKPDWNVTAQQQVQGWRESAVTTYNLTPAAYDTARSLAVEWPAQLSLSNADNNVWKFSSLTGYRPNRIDAWIDGDSGQIITRKTFSDKKLVDQIIGIGIAAHEGQLFGWFNQMLGVFTTLSLLFLSISGFILWRKRKPTGVLGAPPTNTHANTEKTVVIILLVAALFLPMLLLSLIALIIIEKGLLQKMTRIRRWLGLRAKNPL